VYEPIQVLEPANYTYIYMRYLIGSLLIFGVLVASYCTRTPEVLIIHNVNGYTMTAEGDLRRFDALAIRNGKVLDRGSADALMVAYPYSRRLDGERRTLLPGLIDAHAHVMGLGDGLLNVNVMGLESLDSTLEELASYASRYPELTWIRGRGWNQVIWSRDFPTASDLDAVVDDRPVYLTRVDGHAAWVNSEALRIAGINRDTPDPVGGAILKDADGEPNGILIDRAMYLVSQHIPPPNEDEQRLALVTALDEIRSVGLTGVHDAGTSVAGFRLMKEFADAGELTTRIYGMISGAGDVFDRLAADGPVIGYARDLLHLRSVKIYSDGALGSRGAALIEDYSDDRGNRGLIFSTEEEFTEMILKVASAGFQAGVHAIGDRGNRVVLNAFENVRDSLGDQGLRHRIEHAQVVSPTDIPRFRELGIIASMQPVHATSDMNMAGDRLGLRRILGAYAWRTFLDEGVVVAAGSDFPVELTNPFHGLYSAVTRMDQAGRPPGGWYANQALSREEALYAFTMAAAWAGHMEDVVGSLEPGKWADFILIDRDYFEIPESEIWQIQVLETWVAGETVYRKNTAD
jgi:predicted amidohydrolase YtcJ